MTPKIKIVAVAVGAVLVYLLFDLLIVTDLERLERTIADLRKAVEAADAERCISFVSPDYQYEGETREQLLEIGRQLFKATGPLEIKEINRKKPRITGATAVYDSKMLVTFTRPSNDMLYATGKALSEWRLSFRKEGDRWLVYQVELLSVNNQPFGRRGLGALPR